MGMYIAPVKATDERETPNEFFALLDKEFHFTLDVCATVKNSKCNYYFGAEHDALRQRWHGVCWMNPPYSKVGTWIKKAYEESLYGTTIVCLVPSATDTKWWHRYATRGEIRFVRGRIKFVGQKSNAPFPSAIIIFRPK